MCIIHYNIMYTNTKDTDKASRGWNDPPNLPVGAPSLVAPKRPGINLNKRIAFPLTGDVQAVSSASKPMLVPPKQTSVAATPKLFNPATEGGDQKCKKQAEATPTLGDLDQPPSLKDTAANLETVLAYADSIEHKGDIIKRLDDMKKMWKDGQLDNQLHGKVFQISQALVNKDVDTALALQLELVACWPSESSKWAVALRCLINYLRLSSVTSSQDVSEDQSESAEQL